MKQGASEGQLPSPPESLPDLAAVQELPNGSLPFLSSDPPALEIFSRLGDIGSPYDSLLVPEISYLNSDQIHTSITRLKGCLKSLVLEGRTLFIHPMLYHESIPAAYQD